MQPTKPERIISVITALLLVFVMAHSWQAASHAPAATRLLAAEGDSNFTNVVTSGDITVGDDLTVSDDVTISGDLAVTTDLSISDDLTVTDLATIADLAVTEELTVTGNATLNSDVLVDNDLNITEQTRIVVTDGSTITPLGTFTPISSTATTGTSSIAPGTVAGQLLILHNQGAQTITLTDTGTLHLTGNASMTSDDSTILIWDGAAWNQLAAESAN